jgi:RNA polymerase sigma-70 factor (ECF subfamily)
MASSEVLEFFEQERPQLLGLAYRMLGVVAEAEDVVQDAWLRWQATDLGKVERPAAWLTTVVTRLALDRLRVQRRRRQGYVGPWLPEPVLVERGPEEIAELSESLTIGFLALLDNLQPLERAVYLLVDVFGHPYAEVAPTVDKSEAACRQIVSRARRRMRQGHEPSVRDSRFADAGRLVHELLVAIATGDVKAALSRVAPDVVLVTDGGADRHAARHPVVGADRVVRLLTNLARRDPYCRAEASMHPVNGCQGVVLTVGGQIEMVMAFEVGTPSAVSKIWAMLNPDKLRSLGSPFRGV